MNITIFSGKVLHKKRKRRHTDLFHCSQQSQLLWHWQFGQRISSDPVEKTTGSFICCSILYTVFRPMVSCWGKAPVNVGSSEVVQPTHHLLIRAVWGGLSRGTVQRHTALRCVPADMTTLAGIVATVCRTRINRFGYFGMEFEAICHELLKCCRVNNNTTTFDIYLEYCSSLSPLTKLIISVPYNK